MTSLIDIHWHLGVCSATLDSPATGNSLSPGLVNALSGLLDQCDRRHPELLSLRGAGRHFCTGFDLSSLDEETDDSLLARFCRIEVLLQRIHRLPFPTLAIAHGRAVGAGADLFAACSHRVAAPGTQFSFPGALGFGLVLGTRRLSLRVGSSRAREWVTSGRKINLDEALVAGLATASCDGPASNIDLDAVRRTDRSNALDNPLLQSALDAEGAVHDHIDLSLLARSAAIAGLKDRVRTYVRGVRKSSSSPRSSATSLG